MNSADDLPGLLHACIADGRLSDDERRALSDALSEARPLEENLRRVRNKAFEIAHQQLTAQEDGATVLRWLEGVMRAVDGARNPSNPVRHSACFSPGEDCLRLIVQQLRTARQSVDICVFTVSDNRISDEIVAAHQRGVRVRIITDNDKEADAGSDVGDFRDVGIALAVDRSAAHMHHKFAIFDRVCLLNGSYNWTRSAAQHNEENLVLSTEPILIRAFLDRFEKLWQSLADSN